MYTPKREAQTELTVLGEILHQGRLRDDVGAFSRLLIDDWHAMAMLLDKRRADIGKRAGLRYRHKGIASGQVRDGHVVRADVDELFFATFDLELR